MDKNLRNFLIFLATIFIVGILLVIYENDNKRSAFIECVKSYAASDRSHEEIIKICKNV